MMSATVSRIIQIKTIVAAIVASFVAIAGSSVCAGPAASSESCDTSVHSWNTGQGNDARPSAATIADIDGDGVLDIAISLANVGGVLGCSNVAPLAGVVSGRTRELLFTLGARNSCEAISAAVGAAGDVNGDGVVDILVGAGRIDELGWVEVYSGIDGALLLHVDGETEGDFFGRSVCGIGDITDDGMDDFVVGAPRFNRDIGPRRSGRIYFIRGGGSEDPDAGSVLQFIDGRRADELFGQDLASLRGFLGPETDALAIAAPPRVGATLGSVIFLDPASGTRLLGLAGDVSGELFGASVAGGGDVDGDGIADLLIGSPGRPASRHAGRVFIVHGGDALPLAQSILSGDQIGEGFGIGVAIVEDLDDDGLADLAIGSPGFSINDWTQDVGRVTLHSGSSHSLLSSIRGSGAGHKQGSVLRAASDLSGAGEAGLLVASDARGGRISLHILGDRDGSGIADVCEPCSEITDLDVSSAEFFDVSTLSPRRCFRFLPNPGLTYRFWFVSENPGDILSLRLRAGEPPTFREYDQTLSRPSEDSVSLVVPRSGDEAIYVLASLASGTASRVEIRVDELDGPTLDSILPPRASTEAEGAVLFEAVVHGTGFDASTRFRFDERNPKDGEEPIQILQREKVLLSSEEAEVTWNMEEAPRGNYDLVTIDEKGDVTNRLDRPFSVVSGSRENLYVSLTGTDLYRLADQSELSLRFVNTGDVAIPAPIFKIRDRDDQTFFRTLDGDGSFRRGEIQLLGSRDGSLGNLLPPGEEGVLTIFYRSVAARPSIRFIVSVFQPEDDDFIEWSELQNPDSGVLTADDWRRDRSPLSVAFGRTWKEYSEGIGGLARRMARRGRRVASVRQLFRFATSVARGRAESALSGVVLLGASGAPLGGVAIAAFSKGVAVATTRTDRAGRFLLEGLSAGDTVELAVDSHSLRGEANGRRAVSVPGAESGAFSKASGDVLGLVLEVSPGGESIAVRPPEKPENDLPNFPPELPDELFAPVAGWSVAVVGSRDPNAKEDDVETGDDDLPLEGEEASRARPLLHYTVFFENSRCATASARKVTLEDHLSTSLYDLTTLRVGTVNYGGDSDDKVALLEQNLWENRLISTEIRDVSVVSLNPFRNRGEECDGGELPECDGDEDAEGAEEVGAGAGAGAGGVDIIESTVRIEVRLVDGEPGFMNLVVEITSCLDGDNCEVHEGFLPPNDCDTHQGEGYLTYSVRLVEGLADDAEIENDIDITFDDDITRTISVSALTDLGTDVPPPAASFPLPVDNPLLDVELRTPVEQALSWQGSVAADSARVVVWQTDDVGERLEPPVFDVELLTSSYQPTEPWQHSTTYEWELTLSNISGPGETTLWTFRSVDLPPEPPVGDIELVEPLDGEEITPNVVLGWEPSSGFEEAPEYYSIYIWADDDEEPQLEAHVGSLTEYSPLGIEAGENYQWQVVVANESGEVPGPVWSFSTGGGFRRGDVNSDGNIDISDAIQSLNWLFLGGEEPFCISAADFDDSGRVDISDAIVELQYLFLGGDPAPEPFKTCADDPTPDDLGCSAFDACD